MKKAFTLAEVLITLGIIGIVAAMTIPTLINNYKKTQTAVLLKKSYSRLTQAIRLSELENGSAIYWRYNISGEEFFNTYLSKFLTLRKATIRNSGLSYKLLNGSPCTETYCTTFSYIGVLNDGTSIIVSDYRGFTNGKLVQFDINGFAGPNQLGKDYFPFLIHPKSGVIPFGHSDFGWDYQRYGDYDRNVIMGSRSYACNKARGGQWCAALIMMDGWELKDDYPW